ncbi:MAG: molecular chaperone HtpG [Candidatus Puniceispirillales bacterium]
MGLEEHNFEAETGKVLNIVINSLYSNKDIFLRELISNASDACDKRRYKSLTDKSFSSSIDLNINLSVDPKAKTLKISDNGIGMSKDELISSLGTIAKSGTKSFLEGITKQKNNKDDLSLIGQFGVGFYSAFMVADKVEVLSKGIGSKKAHHWISDGQSSFTVTESENDIEGTEITLHIKKTEKDYLESFRIETIVKKYSDHIPYPVKLVEIGKDDEIKSLNSASALWMRNKKDIKSDQYEEFYNHLGGIGKPWKTIHNTTEGIVSFTSLLFIPEMKPFDLFNPDRKTSVKLYTNRVFITDECEDLLPSYLRFIKGVVDSEDIDLNVSREMMQSNAALKKISKALVNKILSELKKDFDKDREGYEKFFEEFGAAFKEGIYEDFDRKKSLLDITLFKSSNSENYTSLNEYIARMKDEQTEIYYISGESIDQILTSPQIEGYKSRGLEVIYMVDPIDEFWLPSMSEYEGKSFKSITKGIVDLSKFDIKDEKDNKKKKPATKKDIDNLISEMKSHLGDKVKDIKSSQMLTDSPVCLTADEADMDIHLEKLMRQHKRLDKESKKILEINPSHNLIKSLGKIVSNTKDKEIVNDVSHLLLDQARIVEGELPLDTKGFTDKLSSIITKSLSN